MYLFQAFVRDPFGITEPLRTAYPNDLLSVAELATLPGELPLVLAVPLLVYLYTGQRRKMALVITYLVIANSLIMILKSLFGLPQASDIYQIVSLIPDSDTHGFPSSAAAVATAVYVGMVYELDLGRKRLLGALAGVVILAVSVSRVALEYHFVGDMIAGVFVGALVIVLIGRTFDENIPHAFAVGLVLSLASSIMVGDLKSIIAAGGSLGGLVVSPWITNDTPTVQRRVVLVALGLVVIVLSLFFQPHVSSSHVLTAGLHAALFATILSLPVLLPRNWNVVSNI